MCSSVTPTRVLLLSLLLTCALALLRTASLCGGRHVCSYERAESVLNSDDSRRFTNRLESLKLYATKKKKKKSQTLDSCPPGCKVFIGNVPFHTTEKEIEEMVEDLLGNELITAVNIPRGAKSGRPFGYLFIDFKDPDVALDFVDVADGLLFEDRILNSNIKDSKTPPSEASIRKKKFALERSIYLNNLDYTLDEEEIYNMCEDLLGYDLVERIKIAYDKRTGRPRGFGHVEFKSPETVERALEELDGLEVLDRTLIVSRLTMPGKAIDKDRKALQEDEVKRNERDAKYKRINNNDSDFYRAGGGAGGDMQEPEPELVKERMEDIFSEMMKDIDVSRLQHEDNNNEIAEGRDAETQRDDEAGIENFPRDKSVGVE